MVFHSLPTQFILLQKVVWQGVLLNLAYMVIAILLVHATLWNSGIGVHPTVNSTLVVRLYQVDGNQRIERCAVRYLV